MRYLLVVLCLVCVMAVPVAADMFTIEVPGVYGDYSVNSYMEAAFDFEQSFSSVNMVDIYFYGYVYPGDSVVWVGWEQHNPVGGCFQALITDTDGTLGPELVTTSYTDAYNPYIDEPWMVSGMFDVLLDGKGKVRIDFLSDVYMGTLVEPARGELSQFTITIDGDVATAPVPEPASLLALAGGIPALLILRRRR